MTKKRKIKTPIIENIEKNSTAIVGHNGIYVYDKKRKPKILGRDCVFFNEKRLTCKKLRRLCQHAEKCSLFVSKYDNQSKSKPTIIHNKKNIENVGITAIVLNDNRKCMKEKHTIQDVNAKIRLSLNTTGEIVISNIPAAYCKECNLYFALKKDFQTVKEKGVVLCPVIDKTNDNIVKPNKSYVGGESKVHQLGYNVRKNNGHTTIQRHVILANIIENTNISKHEIESIITRCVSQHKNQPNYSDSVNQWKADLDFVNSYHSGDMPEVVINKIIVGKR